jgi:hypothetical protein
MYYLLVVVNIVLFVDIITFHRPTYVPSFHLVLSSEMNCSIEFCNDSKLYIYNVRLGLIILDL